MCVGRSGKACYGWRARAHGQYEALAPSPEDGSNLLSTTRPSNRETGTGDIAGEVNVIVTPTSNSNESTNESKFEGESQLSMERSYTYFRVERELEIEFDQN